MKAFIIILMTVLILLFNTDVYAAYYGLPGLPDRSSPSPVPDRVLSGYVPTINYEAWYDYSCRATYYYNEFVDKFNLLAAKVGEQLVDKIPANIDYHTGTLEGWIEYKHFSNIMAYGTKTHDKFSRLVAKYNALESRALLTKVDLSKASTKQLLEDIKEKDKTIDQLQKEGDEARKKLLDDIKKQNEKITNLGNDLAKEKNKIKATLEKKIADLEATNLSELNKRNKQIQELKEVNHMLLTAGISIAEITGWIYSYLTVYQVGFHFGGLILLAIAIFVALYWRQWIPATIAAGIGICCAVLPTLAAALFLFSAGITMIAFTIHYISLMSKHGIKGAAMVAGYLVGKTLINKLERRFFNEEDK